jgi:hypothetical protein
MELSFEKWLFIGASLLVLVGGYFLLFFETEAQKEQRLLDEEQTRIEELGEWSLENRVVTSNRELARELGMEMEEYTEKFGDLSSKTKDLHYNTALFLSTVYPGNEGDYVMTVSYGQVEEMSSAYLNIPESSEYITYNVNTIYGEAEPNERAKDLLGDLGFVADDKCLGKVCFITLKPAHIKFLSSSDSFEVKVSGWYYGKLSGDRISTSMEYEIPTSGLVSHLAEKIQFDPEKIDQIQVAKEYLCQNEESLCDDNH